MPHFTQNIIALVLSGAFWFATYWAGWYVFPYLSKTRKTWEQLNLDQRHSLCALTHSTLHGVLVPAGIVVGISHCAIWNDFTAHNCDFLEAVFACTVSYFLVDGILTLYFRVDLWQVFIVHHIVGVMPFAINCFFCTNMHFLIGGGILIELANPFLNWRAYLDLFGMHDTEQAATATYVTFVVWILVRVSWPIYLLYGMVRFAIPDQGSGDPCWGVVPSYITGWAIGVFCMLVCLGVLLPDLLWYYRGGHKTSNADVGDVESSSTALSMQILPLETGHGGGGTDGSGGKVFRRRSSLLIHA